MSPYIEEQLRVHYQVYKSKSPFVQIDLDEANARKVVRSFQAVTKKLSNFKHSISDDDAFSNANCAAAGVWASKRDGKPIKFSYMIEDFVEESNYFDYAKGGMRLAHQGFAWFYVHYQRGRGKTVLLDSLRKGDNESEQDIIDRVADNTYDEIVGTKPPEDPAFLADLDRIEKAWQDCLYALPKDVRNIAGMLIEGIKQTEMAQHLGVSNSHISNLKDVLGLMKPCLHSKKLDREDIEKLLDHRILRFTRSDT